MSPFASLWSMLDGRSLFGLPVLPLICLVIAAAALLASRFLATATPKGLKSLASLPTPPNALPIFGHLLQLNPVTQLHLKFVAWTNEFGGMFRIQALDKTIVVLSDMNLVTPVLGGGTEALPKAAAMYRVFGDVAKPVHGNSADNVFTAADFRSKSVKAVRKELSVAFSMGNMRKVVLPIAREKAQQLAKTWLAASAAASPAAPARLVVESSVSRMTLQIALASIFNMDLDMDFETVPFFPSLEATLEEMSLRMLNPVRKLVQTALPFLPWSRSVKGGIDVCVGVWQKVYERIRDGAPYDAEDTSLSASLWRLKEVHGMSHEEVIGNIAVMVVAGFDTSTGTLAWALYDIASNPRVQRELAAELKAAGLLRSEGSAGRPVEWEDLWALPVFNAVLKETLRLHTVAPLGSIREADRDVAIGGYHIPRGTVVWVPFACLTRSVHNWEQPLEFKPERWQQAAEAAEGSPQEADNRASMPFSMGPRNCLGQNMATVAVRVILLELLSSLWFDVDPSMGSAQEVSSKQVMALTLKFPGGIRLMARPHST